MVIDGLIVHRISGPHFNTGTLTVTHSINVLVAQGQLNPFPYLRRHLDGDWGDLCEADRRRNDAALKSGTARLFSSYHVRPDLTIWIITEWDRSVTTLLLPSDY